jgi:NADPH-dependent curcumin reductase CurA
MAAFQSPGAAMAELNERVVLAHPLQGVPEDTDFRLVTEPVPEPGPGQCLVRHLFVSLDPYQRAAIAGRHMAGRTPLVAGDMPPAECVGVVVRSRNPALPEGTHVRHFGGWQRYALTDGERTHRVDPDAAPLSTYLGILGMPGLTAWGSIIELADVQPGQVVLVSAALGPVGSMVGQLAVWRGATAIGIAGSDAKCAILTDELGFARAVNHRAPDWLAALAAAAPDGVDVYHDNVGGQMLHDAFSVLKLHGQVILCGLMERYNDPARSKPLDLALPILKRAVMKGIVVTDFEDRRDHFFATVAPLVKAGRIHYREDRAEGLANAGGLFARLMRGENVGKAIVAID